MKRPLRPEETRLWAVVTATVRPSPGRAAPKLAAPSPAPSAAPAVGPAKVARPGSAPRPKAAAKPPALDPQGIEPRRKHRIARGREVIEARLDLHGLDQDRARTRLLDFLLDAQAAGARAVLVITGKGYAGQGVLRRRTPEWLADPRLRGVVAGLSPAEAHHGGDGAYYIALRRKAQ
ncbi:Smr/MutS family protein [Caulobacter sp. S45]|uniref:Smr/MutS family protein n=1 Tax=Caulobacter sp. S45 TaxID=1641861 RepID=UPI0015773622|nr:Smr/MutS family protein [Caulobacter sp. S45]